MKVIKKVSGLETAKAAQDEAAAKRNIPKGGLVISRDSRVGRGRHFAMNFSKLVSRLLRHSNRPKWLP